jgi:protein-S-isoprenylcysteine O-methyltransferase Ste14
MRDPASDAPSGAVATPTVASPVAATHIIIHDEASANATGRHWSDIVGCIAFLALAAWDVWIAPAVSLALIPVFAYEIAAGLAFLGRRRARASVRGLGPRIAAYGATFLVPMFLAFAAAKEASWLTPVTRAFPGTAHWAVPAGNILISAGAWLSAWGLWYLRHSISLEPAARALVTRGPYAVARHPLYLAYALSYAGMTIQHPTIQVTVVMVVWFSMTWARIKYEEGILTAVFPEYTAYRTRVGALGPILRRVVGQAS